VPPKETPQRRANGDRRAPTEPLLSRQARLEAAIESIQQTLDVQFKRMAALQAEVDLLKAKQRAS